MSPDSTWTLGDSYDTNTSHKTTDATPITRNENLLALVHHLPTDLHQTVTSIMLLVGDVAADGNVTNAML